MSFLLVLKTFLKTSAAFVYLPRFTELSESGHLLNQMHVKTGYFAGFIVFPMSLEMSDFPLVVWMSSCLAALNFLKFLT